MYVVPAVVANFGRKETNAEFVRAVLSMIDALQEVIPRKYRNRSDIIMNRAVIGISELDEADKTPEHVLFRQTLNSAGLRFSGVNWKSYEPLAVVKGLRAREREANFACRGVPHLTPMRTITNCVCSNRNTQRGKKWAAINHHAPRRTPALAKEIASCRIAHKKVIKTFIDGTWDEDKQDETPLSGITMGDWNDPHYPTWFNLETAYHSGLDYIRFWEVPDGVKLDPIASSSFRIGIDAHKGGVVLFAVS